MGQGVCAGIVDSVWLHPEFYPDGVQFGLCDCVIHLWFDTEPGLPGHLHLGVQIPARIFICLWSLSSPEGGIVEVKDKMSGLR